MKKANAKHNNQVRIIGGTHRGRKITFPDGDGLRPTADSVREKLFNWLGQDLTGQRVLDLFSGSGALSFEAASRNAKQVDACEINKNAIQFLKKNRSELALNGQVNLHQQDGLSFLKNTKEQYDVILLDPPFAWDEWNELFSQLSFCLKTDSYVYVEAGSLPELPAYLEKYREGRSGKSLFVLLRTVENE